MTYTNTMLVLLASICLLTLPATHISWASGYDDDDDDDDFKDFFDAFFDNLWKKLKKLTKKTKANMMAIADHEIRITDLESITVVNGTDGEDGADGQDGADGLNGINGTNGIDGINGINGTDGINGADGIDGQDGMDGIDGINGTDGIDGAQGIQGIPGVNGTDGTDGVDGTTPVFYKVNNSTTITSGYQIYEASCNAGDDAISGGYTVNVPEDASQVFIDKDNGEGSQFGEKWTIGLLDDGNLSTPKEITVSATCLEN